VTTTDLLSTETFGWRPGPPERPQADFSVAFPLAGLANSYEYPRFPLPSATTSRRQSRLAYEAAVLTKRAMDVVVSLATISMLAPVFVVTAIAIKFTSPGPVFFRQERIGLHGRAFRVLKFRSMTAGAEKNVAELMAENGGYQPFYKIRNDPRVTRVGRFLRRASIDELPQLFNVLRGDMSLVGPRPQVYAEVEQYAFQHTTRLTVKPGITGLWQVSGRSDLAWPDAVRLDMRYVDTWSLAGDVGILLKTAKAVVTSRGAY
jgi:exopolysaccharide biosynthesis polyprenyl glycosylphosphotransferase